MFVRLLKRAKLPNHFTPHSLRHTFASYMAMSGASLREIAELLGHSTIHMTMLYTHLMPSHTHSVVEKMAAQWLTTENTEVPHVK